MTVLAVHPLSDKDVSAALIYGELQYVNRRYIYPDELDGDRLPAEFKKRMLVAVDRYDPDHDYLLIAGDHLQIVAMSALLAMRWGEFKVLRFDREAKGYLVALVGE